MSYSAVPLSVCICPTTSVCLLSTSLLLRLPDSCQYLSNSFCLLFCLCLSVSLIHVYALPLVTRVTLVWLRKSSAIIFSRVHATLHLALSVRRSVRPSVTFLNRQWFLYFRSCRTVRGCPPCIRPCFFRFSFLFSALRLRITFDLVSLVLPSPFLPFLSSDHFRFV